MENQLVSVTVVAYNAEKTVEDTLNSIKSQTYKRIELIISDDCSKDKTVEICKKWMLKNSDRFERVELLTSEKNQGVCANGNNARAAAKGIWLKGIAADDILMPNCIADYVDYTTKHPEAVFVTSLMCVYIETFEKQNCLIEEKHPNHQEIFDQSIDNQLKQMAYDSYIQAPTIFIKRDVFWEVGGYNDKYPFEDWPFYMDVLEKGYKIHFMDKVTVGYRVHQSSSNASGKLFNYQFNRETHAFIKERCFKYYTKRKIFATKGRWAVEKTLYKLGMDKKNVFNKFVYDCALWCLARIGGRGE